MWEVFYIFISVLLFLSFIFFIWFLLFFLIVGKKYKYKLPKKIVPKGENYLKMILIDFPIRYWRDRFNYVPGTFEECGFHLICGEQGSGKTVTAAYMLLKWKKQYKQLKIKSNCEYLYQDEALNSANDMIFANNGIYGEVDFVDEIQNWFNSMDSRDFPVEMIQEISQQRKQRKVILATSQVFTRVAKPLREQVNYLYLPITLFKCFTIVRVVKPKLDEDGCVDELRPIKIFAFVHFDELRESFDTFKKIAYMAKGGLVQKNWEPNFWAQRSNGTAPSKQQKK